MFSCFKGVACTKFSPALQFFYNSVLALLNILTGGHLLNGAMHLSSTHVNAGNHPGVIGESIVSYCSELFLGSIPNISEVFPFTRLQQSIPISLTQG
jgi:hypothetical protein